MCVCVALWVEIELWMFWRRGEKGLTRTKRVCGKRGTRDPLTIAPLSAYYQSGVGGGFCSSEKTTRLVIEYPSRHWCAFFWFFFPSPLDMEKKRKENIKHQQPRLLPHQKKGTKILDAFVIKPIFCIHHMFVLALRLSDQPISNSHCNMRAI